jgi:hypothetical protein
MNYIEIIVFINVIIHYGLSVITGYISSIKLNKILLMVSIILDIIFVLLYIYIPYEFEAYKYIFILLIAIIPSINKGSIRCLFYTLVYLMLNFTLGGITDIIYNYINNFSSIIFALIFIIMITLFVYVYKKQKLNYDSLIYDVILEFDKKIVKLKGFCDTGNLLISDDLIPIVFVNKIYIMGKFVKQINVSTINSNDLIDIYIINSFKIKLNKRYVKKDVYIAFVDTGNNEVIFGLDILGG